MFAKVFGELQRRLSRDLCFHENVGSLGALFIRQHVWKILSASVSSKFDADVPEFGIELHGVNAALAADAGLL